MRASHVIVVALLGCVFAACDSKRNGGGGHSQTICEVACECESCADIELQACQDQYDAEEQAAKAGGCADEFDNVYGCFADNGTCTDGVYQVSSVCDDEATDYSTCMTGGNCSIPNGTCDANCPPGTDPDCGDSCGSDGVCNPVCAPGLDPDCGGNCGLDGFCDPSCAPGQDPDCSDICGLDGFCNPDCAPGQDPDCGNNCGFDGFCNPNCAPGVDPDCTPMTCDDIGICGDSVSYCIECALNGNCNGELNICQSDIDCVNYADCISNCVAGDQVCYDNCAAMYPTGAQLYDNIAVCVVCQECYISCDGANSGCP